MKHMQLWQKPYSLSALYNTVQRGNKLLVFTVLLYLFSMTT